MQSMSLAEVSGASKRCSGAGSSKCVNEAIVVDVSSGQLYIGGQGSDGIDGVTNVVNDLRNVLISILS